METQPKEINFPTEAEVEQGSRKLKLMNSAPYFKILHFLCQVDESHGDEIADSISVHRQIVGTNLVRLRDCGILKSRRDGHRVYYSCVNPEAIKTILETALKL